MLGSLLVCGTFHLNARYGEHGLMKLGAGHSRPRFLISRKRLARFVRMNNRKEDE